MNTTLLLRLRKFLCLALLAALPGAAFAAAVAMVLDAQGKVTASRDKRPAAIGIAVSVQDGTEVTVAEGAKLVLTHYATKAHLSFTGPAQFVVGAQEVRKVSGAAPQSRQLPVETARTAQGFKGRIVPAAMVMKGVVPSLVLQQPLPKESVPAEQFEVVWASSSPEVNFRLYEGKNLRGEKTIASQRFPLADIAKLNAGKNYRLVAVAGGKETSVSFSTLSKAQQASLSRLRPSDPAAVEHWVVYAMALEQAGAASSARAAWRHIAEQRHGAGERVGELAE